MQNLISTERPVKNPARAPGGPRLAPSAVHPATAKATTMDMAMIAKAVRSVPARGTAAEINASNDDEEHS